MQSASQSIPFVLPSQVSRSVEPISQLELELFISLRNRLKQLEAEVELQESRLRTRLEAGAGIDPGVHTAELKTSSRRSPSWKEVVIRLAERLKLDGEAYCARVLAATKPTRTISLVVR